MTNVLDQLRRAVRILGSQKALGDAIGKTQQSVSLMLRGEMKISGEDAAAIDTATGGQVSRGCLRPDLFGGQS
jgi:DNA-binding transcriptional regulator YdaS (Cro superfamily)